MAEQGARVLVVVPAYNEEGNVGGVAHRLRALGHDCAVVDDGSTDDTAARARAAGAIVLRLPVNLGVGGALRCGFRYAIDHGYDMVVQCDADGQHAPEAVAGLVAAAHERDAHLVIGSRWLTQPPTYSVGWTRRSMMRWLSRLARLYTGLRLTDTTSGFRAIARPLLDEFARSYPVHYLGDTFEAAVVAARAGYRVVEVPVPMHERQSGASSANPIAAVAFVIRSVISVTTGLGFRIKGADGGRARRRYFRSGSGAE
jgi:glycosyltransferase involved in cell wall biosynthesis